MLALYPVAKRWVTVFGDWIHHLSKQDYTILVGGFKHFFPIIYGIILPIGQYFSKWLKPPTSTIYWPVIISLSFVLMNNFHLLDIFSMYHLASVEPFDDDVSLQCAPPSDRWFKFAPITIVIGTINHSYWSYVHQLNAIVAGGLTLYAWWLSHVPKRSPRTIPTFWSSGVIGGCPGHVWWQRRVPCLIPCPMVLHGLSARKPHWNQVEEVFDAISYCKGAPIERAEGSGHVLRSSRKFKSRAWRACCMIASPKMYIYRTYIYTV